MTLDSLVATELMDQVSAHYDHVRSALLRKAEIKTKTFTITPNKKEPNMELEGGFLSIISSYIKRAQKKRPT